MSCPQEPVFLSRPKLQSELFFLTYHMKTRIKLILFLPGTGKTQTIVAIVNLLVMMGKSVLITSHTHSAVDNVLLRLLKENLMFMRLADPSRVPDEIKDFCESVLTIDCKTPEELSQMYNTYVCSLHSHLC